MAKHGSKSFLLNFPGIDVAVDDDSWKELVQRFSVECGCWITGGGDILVVAIGMLNKEMHVEVFEHGKGSINSGHFSSLVENLMSDQKL